MRLRRLIVATGTALVLAFTASAVYDGWRLHEQLQSFNDRELGNMTRALAQSASVNLYGVDLLMRETVQWYEQTGRFMNPEQRKAMFDARLAGVVQADLVTIIDASGMQTLRSHATDVPLADVSNRDYFTRQRDDPGLGLFINPPIVARTQNAPTLIVSRRLNYPDGSFMGIVSANLKVTRLAEMYSAFDFGEGSAMVLALSDGTVVVREPAANVVPGRKMEELPALRQDNRVERVVSPVDGRRKSVAVVGVGSWPLMLAITRDEQTSLRPWRDEARSGAIRTVILALLIALTMRQVLRQLERLDSSEQALRHSEQRYAMVMEATAEGYAEWNLGDNTVFASNRWRTLHGLAPAPLGDTAQDFIQDAAQLLEQVAVHPDDADPARSAIEAHLAGRTESIAIEYRVELSDGQWRWIEARGRCIGDDASEHAVRRMFSTASDITARKHAEIQEEARLSRLQQTARLEALGTLAGGIAHDFNNILGAILGFGEMAHQGAEPGSAMRRHLDRVMQAAARARLLVRKILDFSRSGVAIAESVNFQAVVEEVVDMVTPSLPPSVRLSADLNASSAAVLADATQLHQIVMNLVTNAVQATGDVGEISAHLQRTEVDSIVSMPHGRLQPGSYLRLDVLDQGSGISPAVLDRIFEPFFTTKRVGEGTGLGLSVVHGIVTDLQGAIDIESTDRGTRASVWLPVHGEVEAIRENIESSESPLGSGQSVMIVDDEPALVELIEELLASLGYEPVGFSSAERALAAFDEDPSRFDAVLTDEMLPGLTGSEFARRLHAVRPLLPVILMTGRPSEELERIAAETGIRTVMSKPLSLQAIASQLAESLKRV